MLLGKDLCRGEQGGLAACIDDLQHRPDRDDRLSRADLALQQPVHWMVERELIGDRRTGQLLADRQLERQQPVEGRQQPAIPALPRRGREGGGSSPPLRQDHLQHERLIPLQPHLGAVHIGAVDRPVDAAQGVGQAGQAIPPAHLAGQQVIVHVEGVQRDQHRVRDLPGGDLAAGPVDGDQLGREVGRPDSGLAGAKQLAFGVGQLALALERRDLAREQSAQAWREHLLPPVLPAFAEEGQRKPPVTVGHGRLEYRARTVAHLSDPHRRDLCLHGYVLTVAQRRQIGQLAPGVIPARVVAKQLAHGLQVERRLQPFGRLLAHDGAQRIRESRHRPVSPPWSRRAPRQPRGPSAAPLRRR